MHIIDDSLQQTSSRVQEAAAPCLRSFLQTYHSQTPFDHIQQYCGMLSNHIQCRRIGGALALAVVPTMLITADWTNTARKVCDAIDVETAPEKGDVDSRVAAIKACPYSSKHVRSSGSHNQDHEVTCRHS